MIDERLVRLASLQMIERDPLEYKCSECRHYVPEGTMFHPVDNGALKHFPARCLRTDMVRGDGWHAERCDSERHGGCGPLAFYWEPRP